MPINRKYLDTLWMEKCHIYMSYIWETATSVRNFKGLNSIQERRTQLISMAYFDFLKLTLLENYMISKKVCRKNKQIYSMHV